MTTKEMMTSRKIRLAAAVVGVLILMLVSFASGVLVGFKKARFSYSWGENYERNFVGPRMGPGGPMGDPRGMMENRDLRNAHGISGSIVSISDTSLVIKDKDNKENTVAITDMTLIKDGRNDVKIADLKKDERVIVVGNPDDSGVLNADLIRVFSRNANQDRGSSPANSSSSISDNNPDNNEQK
ncbi:MAG: hypothetical protein HGB08_03240 [Candidatus Moranbacteria bacterium]|nr:hypothetical protein [Candidatus Moranbacteria bacterium]